MWLSKTFEVTLLMVFIGIVNAIWLDIIVFDFFLDGCDVGLLAELRLP
jgi:hypothetical protein